jgi:hypothetical protein
MSGWSVTDGDDHPDDCSHKTCSGTQPTCSTGSSQWLLSDGSVVSMGCKCRRKISFGIGEEEHEEVQEGELEVTVDAGCGDVSSESTSISK